MSCGVYYHNDHLDRRACPSETRVDLLWIGVLLMVVNT